MTLEERDLLEKVEKTIEQFNEMNKESARVNSILNYDEWYRTGGENEDFNNYLKDAKRKIKEHQDIVDIYKVINGVFNTNIDNTFNIFTNVLNVKINKEVIKTKYPIEWNNKEYYLPIEYVEYSIANE